MLLPFPGPLCPEAPSFSCKMHHPREENQGQNLIFDLHDHLNKYLLWILTLTPELKGEIHISDLLGDSTMVLCDAKN